MAGSLLAMTVYFSCELAQTGSIELCFKWPKRRSKEKLNLALKLLGSISVCFGTFLHLGVALTNSTEHCHSASSPPVCVSPQHIQETVWERRDRWRENKQSVPSPNSKLPVAYLIIIIIICCNFSNPQNKSVLKCCCVTASD